jgi:hypothetical protein
MRPSNAVVDESVSCHDVAVRCCIGGQRRPLLRHNPQSSRARGRASTAYSSATHRLKFATGKMCTVPSRLAVVPEQTSAGVALEF